MTVPFIGTNDLSDALDLDVVSEDLAIIAVDSACEIVRSYLDNVLNVRTAEDRLDGTGTDGLVLDDPPVREVIAVTVDDALLSEDVDYYLDDRDSGVLRRIGTVWTLGRGNVIVSYERGYDFIELVGSGDFIRMPSDIRLVALSVAKRIYNSQGTSTTGIVAETIGDYSYRIGDPGAAVAAQLLESERAVLDHYARPRLA